MRFFIRLIERIFIFSLSAFLFWFIANNIFDRLEQKIPFFFSLILTYIITAYFIYPKIVNFIYMISRRGRIPRVTKAIDGLPADIVNIILVGTKKDLITAFSKIGWCQADKLTIKNNWKIIKGFVLNTPYINAPFSKLYLFGRMQDIGFQENIGNSPRKRNHIRFWAANIDPRKNVGDFRYWFKKHTVDVSEQNYWVGAGSEDLGLGLTKFTYQISHRTNKYIDKQRDYIFDLLKKHNCVYGEHFISPGEIVAGKYISDGRILFAEIEKIEK